VSRSRSLGAPKRMNTAHACFLTRACEPVFEKSGSPFKNVFFRSNRSNEAQISLETIIRLELPHVGCYFFNGRLPIVLVVHPAEVNSVLEDSNRRDRKGKHAGPGLQMAGW